MLCKIVVALDSSSCFFDDVQNEKSVKAGERTQIHEGDLIAKPGVVYAEVVDTESA